MTNLKLPIDQYLLSKAKASLQLSIYLYSKNIVIIAGKDLHICKIGQLIQYLREKLDANQLRSLQ